MCECIVGTCVAMVQWQRGEQEKKEKGGGLHRTVAKMKQHKNSIYITLNFPEKKTKKKLFEFIAHLFGWNGFDSIDMIKLKRHNHILR